MPHSPTRFCADETSQDVHRCEPLGTHRTHSKRNNTRKDPHRILQEQLRLARDVQEALLPPQVSKLSGLELATGFFPSTDVSGDFMDSFVLGSRQVAFYMGDVQGKGLEAAMYALLVSGVLRGIHKCGKEPADVVAFLNGRLCLRPILAKFCCLGYGVFDLELRQLSYASAGLPHPLLLRGQAVTYLEVTGYPVGMFNTSVYDQTIINLQAGDILVFYTDGLPDSLGNDGRKHLGKAVSTGPKQSAKEFSAALAASLKKACAGHEDGQIDDAAFLVFRIP